MNKEDIKLSPIYPRWETVQIPKDGVQRDGRLGKVGHDAKVKASLRWWNSHGEHTQVKGDLTLERFFVTNLFRIRYDGMQIGADSKNARAVHGTIYFPIELSANPLIHIEVLHSKRVSANGIRITWPSNSDGLETIQLVIPATTHEADEAGKLFAAALEFAEAERSGLSLKKSRA